MPPDDPLTLYEEPWEDETAYVSMEREQRVPGLRRSLTVQDMKQALRTNEIATRLRGAREALLPHCRLALPSITPLQKMLPRGMGRRLSSASQSQSAQSPTHRAPWPRKSRSLGRLGPFPATTSSEGTQQAGLNQVTASREDALAKALAWIERLEEADSAFAYQRSHDAVATSRTQQDQL